MTIAKKLVNPLSLSTPPHLVLEDWDFSACPKEELGCCCFYEYAREKSSVKQRVAVRRAYDDWGVHLPLDDETFYEEKWFTEFFRDLEEFPKTPWLRIDSSKRVQRRERQKLELIKTVYPERFAVFLNEERYPYLSEVSPSSVRTIHAVEIDWANSDKRLVEAFKVWLAHNRPFRFQISQKGKRTPAEALVFLGAFRLLRAFNNDCEKAKSVKAYYGDKRTWRGAKKKALKIIGEVKPKAADVAERDLFEMPHVELDPVKVEFLAKAKKLAPGESVRLVDLVPTYLKRIADGGP